MPMLEWFDKRSDDDPGLVIDDPFRQCGECAFSIDAEPAIPCAKHKWHNETWDDMCCLCGLAAEMLVK
jgi:hypothetical protein